MTTKIKVPNCKLLNFGKENILKLAKEVNGQYVEDYAFEGDNVWSLFYCPVLKDPKHAHLCGFRWFNRDPLGPDVPANRTLRVAGFDKYLPLALPGVFLAKQRVFLHSRYVHNYYQSQYGLAVDGGFSYLRLVGDFANVVNATFNPMTMEIKDNAGQDLGVAEYTDVDRRNLRRETAR